MNTGVYNVKLMAAKRRIFDSLKRDGDLIDGVKHTKLISLFLSRNDFQRPIEMRWQDYIIQLYELNQLPDITPRKRIVSKYQVHKDKIDEYRQRYLDYLKSAEWKKIREESIEHWGGKCILCCSDKKLQGHHRTYKNLFHETVYDVVPLCFNCHKKHHDK